MCQCWFQEGFPQTPTIWVSNTSLCSSFTLHPNWCTVHFPGILPTTQGQVQLLVVTVLPILPLGPGSQPTCTSSAFGKETLSLAVRSQHEAAMCLTRKAGVLLLFSVMLQLPSNNNTVTWMVGSDQVDTLGICPKQHCKMKKSQRHARGWHCGIVLNLAPAMLASIRIGS